MREDGDNAMRRGKREGGREGGSGESNIKEEENMHAFQGKSYGWPLPFCWSVFLKTHLSLFFFFSFRSDELESRPLGPARSLLMYL